MAGVEANTITTNFTTFFYLSFAQVSVYTFLFTDMLLVTKPIRRSGKYIIIRPVSCWYFLPSFSNLCTYLCSCRLALHTLQPYRVSSLQINLREQGQHRHTLKLYYLILNILVSGLICCVVVNEFNVASDFFTLKAQSVTTAQVWVEQIELAKVIVLYNSLAARYG